MFHTIARTIKIRRAHLFPLIAFAQFFLLRAIPWPKWLPVPAKYADADIYINAGNALLTGALPGSVNSGHPPLAEYIIGFFSVYLNSPNGSAFVFGFLVAILAFLIADRLTGDLKWSALAVWILGVDQVNISLSIRPMLEIFMIFFGMLSFYLILTADGRLLRYLVAGLSFGFALACKLTAIFLVVPAMLLLVYERKFRESVALLGLTAIGYVLPYSQLLLTKGLDGFWSSQVLMLNIEYGLHIRGGSVNLITRMLTPLIVHTTTLAPQEGFVGFPPNIFGPSFASIADSVNAPEVLLVLPILFWLVRNRASQSGEKCRAIRLLILTVICFMAYEAIFPTMIAVWYFAPLGTVVAIAAPAMLASFQKRSNLSRSLTYLYLTVLSTWILWANSIYFALIRQALQGG